MHEGLPLLTPVFVKTDYELAAINAFRSTFPKTVAIFVS